MDNTSKKSFLAWFSVIVFVMSVIWSGATAHTQIDVNKKEVEKAERERKEIKKEIEKQKTEAADRLARIEEKSKNIEKTTDRIEEKLDRALQKDD